MRCNFQFAHPPTRIFSLNHRCGLAIWKKLPKLTRTNVCSNRSPVTCGDCPNVPVNAKCNTFCASNFGENLAGGSSTVLQTTTRCSKWGTGGVEISRHGRGMGVQHHKMKEKWRKTMKMPFLGHLWRLPSVPANLKNRANV